MRTISSTGGETPIAVGWGNGVAWTEIARRASKPAQVAMHGGGNPNSTCFREIGFSMFSECNGPNASGPTDLATGCACNRIRIRGPQGGGRGDMAGLRGGTRAQSRGPCQKGPADGAGRQTGSADRWAAGRCRLQIEVKQQQTIISPPIVAQEVRESHERGCARKADIACPSQRDGLSLDRTCCRIRYAPTVALP
jgi:hypothetical protein